MGTRIVQSPADSPRFRGRERARVFALAGSIVVGVAVYLAVNAGRESTGASRGLFPYQTLARTLPASDQVQFRAVRDVLPAAEVVRARASRWPEPASLALPAAGYHWTRFEHGLITNYFGQPQDPAHPAWLLEIQEPEPGVPPDPAPNDDEHHRLPDGTTLHVYVWMHNYGGQVAAGFVPQPQNSGWVEVFSTVPNPAFAIRR
jgi:hypothetical protein